MRRTTVALAASLVVLGGALAPSATSEAPKAAVEEWRSFAGTWSATGQLQTLPTEHGRDAGILQLSGAVVLTGGDGLGRGFRGELICFDDGHVVTVGRWLWTDERGDRVFGELTGEPMQTGRRFTGTITGGTGRYAALTGTYTFTWQFMVEAEDGIVQGRAVGLEGRYRFSAAQP